jgi:outer membrane protein TolC
MKISITLFLQLLPILLMGQVKLNNVEEAVTMAKERNTEIQAAVYRMEIEKQTARMRSGQFLPQVRAFSTLDHNIALPVQLIPAEFLGGTPGEFMTAQFGTAYVLNAGVEVSIPLINVADWYETNAAWLNRKVAENAASATEFEISKQVSQVYYRCLLAGHNVDLAIKNLEISDSLLWTAQRRYGQHLLDPLEYNRIRNNNLQAKDRYEQSQNLNKVSLNQLRLMLQLGPEENIVLTEALESLADEPLILSSSAESNPMVVYRESLFILTQAQLKSDQMRRLPSLSLYGRQIKNAQQNTINFFLPNSRWFDVGMVGARLDVPIFNGGVRQSQINRTRQRLELAKLDRDHELLKAKLEDKDVQENYGQSLKSYHYQQQSYNFGIENLEGALLKYREGLYNLDQYLNVYNENLLIQQNYLKSISDLLLQTSLIQLKNKY